MSAPLDPIDEITSALEKASASGKTFDELLGRIQGLKAEKRSLWLEIYQNAVDDRARARVMFDTLVDTCGARSAELAVHGQTISKYMERMSRANDQLMKLSELVTAAEEKQETVDVNSAYDQIMNKSSGGRGR